MKKHIKVGIAALAALLVSAPLASCGGQDKPDTPDVPVNPDVEVTEVTCTETEANMFIGDAHALTCGVLPENATNKTLTYSSSNQAVATVDAEGVITAKAKGLAIITISSNNGKTKQVVISVSEKEQEVINVTGVTVDFEEATLKIGETKQITAAVLPENATNTNLEFLSDNTKIASVDETGLITAKAEGDAEITVRSEENAAVYKKIAISVLTNIVPVESISTTVSSFNLFVGDAERDHATIGTTVLPENATNKTVNFSVKSSDTAVCEVNANGEILAKAPGDAIINVVSDQNPAVFTTVSVHVENVHTDVESISAPSKINIEPGSGTALSASVLPDNATNKSLTYVSNDEDIATVDANGNVLAVAEGDTFITITSVDNPSVFKVVQVEVRVNVKHVESLAIAEEDMSIDFGDVKTIELHASVLPDDADNKEVFWRTDNSSVATVDEDGKITVKGCGVAHITAVSADNAEASDEFTLTVGKVEVEKIEIKNDGESISSYDFTVEDIGVKTLELDAVISPENATEKDVLWSSSDSSVASVAEGVITPLKEGITTVTATNLDSGKQAKVTINVNAIEVTSIEVSGTTDDALNFASSDIAEGNTKTLTAKCLPENATHKEIRWSSLNSNIVTVENGVVTPKGVGSTYVRVTSTSNPNAYKDVPVQVSEILVNKIELLVNEAEVTSLKFSTDDIGNTSKDVVVEANVLPGTAFDKDVSWTSDNTSVAIVVDGKISPKGEGKCNVIAKNIKSGVSASISVEVVKPLDYLLSPGIVQNKSFVDFAANKSAKPGNTNEEYYNRDEDYKVGTDNLVHLLPQLSVVNLDGNPVDQSLWAFDYSIKVEKYVDSAYVDAPIADYTIGDQNKKDCTIKFNTSAQNSKFKVTIAPGGMDEAGFTEQEKLRTTVSYEFKVVKGFNVYDEIDFSYFDSTTASTYANEEFSYMFSGETDGEEGGMPRTSIDWPKFKREHNLDETESHNTLILQNNLSFDKNDVPADFFYSKNEGLAGKFNDDELKDYTADGAGGDIGSLKDDTALFVHHSDGDMNVDGNYFKVSFENMPLIHRFRGRRYGVNAKDSHSTFLKTTKGYISIKNINFQGNSHNAVDDTWLKYSGGLFLAKVSDATKNLLMDNILAHSLYITVMSEQSDKFSHGATIPMQLHQMKCFDNYNCFLYNWSGVLNADQALFEGCGGPVVIQDHTGVQTDPGADDYGSKPTQYDDFNGEGGTFKVYGNPSKTIFNNCVFNNYVEGTEAWFKSFGVDGIATTKIKPLNDILSVFGTDWTQSGATKTFLTAKMDGEHRIPILNMVAGGTSTEFNFIVLNKSGNAEAESVSPVDGTVIFKTNDVATDMFDYMNPVGQVSTSIPAQVYQGFRTLNGAGAPVFEYNSGAFGYTATSLDPTAVVPLTTAAQDPTVVSGAGDYMALYFNGMMLVFQIYDISL